MPEKSGQSDSLRASWTAILRTPLFVRYAVANMLCVTSMLLFLSNYSYLLQQDFRIGATGSGYVLALFNACIAAGVYLVRYLAPRLGVEHTVRLGLAAAVGGWLVVLASSLVISNPSVSLLAPIALTGLGYGMVISLCAGKAMTPFSQLAGSASALYLFIQSVGSALINLLVSQVLEKSLVQLSSALLVISVLAIICMSLAAPRDSAINT